MYEQTLEDMYYSMSTDELLMLITSYRHDKEKMISSGDIDGADKTHITIQYLRQILNSKAV
jgi:hypothetical protein